MTDEEAGRDPRDGRHARERPPRPGAGPIEPPSLTLDQQVRLAELLTSVEDAGEVVVLTHDNPDPDAIASAAALAHLLEREAGVDTTLAFGGIIGRAENRALIEELDVTFQRIRPTELPTSLLVALVDTQPRTGNNSLPDGRIASVVIDHHPLRPETGASAFVDVRPEYGASCSILVEYLRAAELEPPRLLATALFYGIQSETMDLGREASDADVAASMFLYPRSDPDAIARIRHARVPAGYLGTIHAALEKARRAEGVVWVPAGRLDYPDMVAELADLFMRVEDVRWALAVGRYHDDLLISVRTHEPGAHAGGLIRRVVGERGSAGGHGMLAGAQIPVGRLDDAQVERLQAGLYRELLAELGVDPATAEPVVPLELAEPTPPGGEVGSGEAPDAGSSGQGPGEPVATASEDGEEAAR